MALAPSYTGSRLATPVAGSSATTIIDAWQKAVATFARSLPSKHLQKIQSQTTPRDIVAQMKEWEQDHKKTGHATLTRAFEACINRVEKFSAAIDQLAQGSPQPACLLWGCIKFVLLVAKDAAEEYSKLCKALLLIADCLPEIEIYSTTFSEYEMLQTCVYDFYVSVLRFWTRACKFYERRRLWKIFTSAWVDYGAELQTLESELKRTRERVEKVSVAKHVEQSELARIEQRSATQVMLQAGESHRRKEITTWLAPIGYHADYFVRDQEAARALRYSDTCLWVLNKKEFQEWTNDITKGPLWIYAKPGAGKTILSSFLIDHYRSKNTTGKPGKVLYFFCKDTDTDKNTSLAVLRSLLYQLYRSEISNQHHLATQLADALDNSGQRKATDYSTLWELFHKHIQESPETTIVIDALDECQEPKVMVKHLIELSHSYPVRIIFTSRREIHLPKKLEACSSFEISRQDIDGDIRVFIKAKVAGRRAYWGPCLGDSVVARLSEGHEGMFLWVVLVLKELKHCTSQSGIQKTLVDLPKGLDMVYCQILQRLQKVLGNNSRDICRKVLGWVVTALRPLRIEELRDAVTAQYQYEGGNILAGDQILDYPERNLVLACGSLITIEDGVVQLIHLSTKEFLQSPQYVGSIPADCSEFLVNRSFTSLQLTMSCLANISSSCKEPVTVLDGDIPQFDLAIDKDQLKERLLLFPLMGYSVSSWLNHLHNCNLLSSQEITSAVRKTYDSPCTFFWIEICLALDPANLHRVLSNLEGLREWIGKAKSNSSIEFGEDGAFVNAWCAALLRLLTNYGGVLSLRPYEVHTLDLRSTFQAADLHGLYEKHAGHASRGLHTQLCDYINPFSSQGSAKNNKLQLHQKLWTPFTSWGFLIYDERRDVFFYAESFIDECAESLHAQERTTGRHLQPATKFDKQVSGSRLLEAVLSTDGKYMGVLYGGTRRDIRMQRFWMSIWRIDDELCFERQSNRGPWAQRIISHISETTLYRWSFGALVFGDDARFYFPGGIIKPSASDQKLLVELIHGPQEKSAYSGDGNFLVLLSSTGSVEKVSTKDTTVSECFKCISFDPGVTRHWMVSHTGRYLLFVDRWFGLELFDTILLKVKTLVRGSAVVKNFEKDMTLCYFSVDDAKLFGFILNDDGYVPVVDVLIWDFLADEPQIISRGSFATRSIMSRSHIFVQKDESAAWLVKGPERIPERIALTVPEVTIPIRLKLGENHPRISSNISDDGTRLCLVSHERNKAQVQISNLTSTDTAVRRLHLELSSSVEAEIKASRDLSLLAIGDDVFHIGHVNDSLASTAFVKPPISMENVTWCFSSCNSYIACTTRHSFRGIPQRREWARFAMFRVDLALRTLILLDLPLPEKILKIFIDFHPRLPLLLLSYSNFSTLEERPVGANAVELHVAIYTLGTLASKHIKVTGERITRSSQLMLWVLDMRLGLKRRARAA